MDIVLLWQCFVSDLKWRPTAHICFVSPACCRVSEHVKCKLVAHVLLVRCGSGVSVGHEMTIGKPCVLQFFLLK
eukprot:563204-Amphidinium_carterae.1